MAKKTNRSKAIAQHNLEQMLSGSAYQHMTERVLREDAAKKQGNGLKLKPPAADGPCAKRTKALVAHLKKLKAGLPLTVKDQDDAPMNLFRRDMAKAGERYMSKHGVSAAEAVSVMADFTAAWATRAVHEFSCPSRKKGEKECKCVRH